MRRHPRDPHEDPPRPRRYQTPRGPVPTLADLRQETCWVWVWCASGVCQHHAPMAIVPLIIRWGGNASSDVLRQRAVCTACGRRGATLQHPSWVDRQVGFMPFPVPQPPAG